ncbi:MAG: hypothetical protein AB7G93_16270 [Bdellovibrionales bacterium]
MLKLFSAPIVVGIALGLLFPYQSLSLIWVSSILLFLLLFLNTLSVDSRKIFAVSRNQAWQSLTAQVLIFFIFPVIQTGAAAAILHDPDFVFGVAVSSLAPAALVNPFFAHVRGGDRALALLNVILSTVLSPLLTVPLLFALGLGAVFINSRFLFVYLIGLTALPVLLSFGVTTLWPGAGARIQRILPAANSLILAALMFILVGSSLNRVPVRLLLKGDFPNLLLLFVGIDFGIFIAVRAAAKLFLPIPGAETLALSVATRNFAVSASLMLLFHPKAALPSAAGLIIHCLFFQWLVWRGARSRSASAEECAM